MILSFKELFVPAIVAGTKPHSIRAGGRWRAGMSIQFYQGSYHQKRHKFRPDAVVTSVQRIVIERGHRLGENIYVDGRPLMPAECDTLARNDGFNSAQELLGFVDQLHGLPFTGQLIHWTDLTY